MKKLFLATLFAILSLCVNAYDYYNLRTVDGINYYITGENTVEVAHNGQYTGDLVIPNSIICDSKEYSVTRIGDYAFSFSGLRSINIPANTTSIGVCAFAFCGNLTSIVVASGNSVYDSRNNCNAIIRTSDNYLLQGCSGTVIPDGVQSIGNSAFSFTGLMGINIPTSVTSIEERAFSYCGILTSITVASGNSVYDSRNNCNAIIKTADNSLLYGCNGTVIPDGVTSIAKEAFLYCNLRSIDIPTSVTSIGGCAFEGCSSLATINIPESVTSIAYGTFAYCLDLTFINIPANVTSIGRGAFNSCI